jgi:glycosyltransferase involved in cell wall biosynthesis
MPPSAFVTTRCIVFWEPSVSPHKAGLFAALARLAPDLSIIECADRDIADDRKTLGWPTVASDGYKTVIAPDQAQIRELVGETTRQTLHIFSGIRRVSTIVAGLAAVRRAGARFAIMSEPRVREGWKGALRFLQSWLTEGDLRRNVQFVLAIGRNGPPWFASVGYATEQIFPFAYFVAPPVYDTAPEATQTGRGRSLQIGYLGRLVEAKGVFDVVRSAALLDNSLRLHVGGCGPDEERLRAFATQLKVSAHFHGVIQMSDVGSFLCGLDVLVLASTTTDDGWGVVVSESLMCGTAVIATDRVGASLVLDNPELGRVVQAQRPNKIAEAVRDLAACGAFQPAARGRRAAWAKSMLSAEAGAAYLKCIIAWSEGRSEMPTGFHVAGQSV